MSKEMEWQDYLKEHRQRFIDELLAFIKIPSISAQTEYADDVYRAGEWFAQRLKAAGLNNVQLMPTGGHPVVYGDWIQSPDLPTILIYGHFDVQPVDPLELWKLPPFEASIVNDCIYGRGASDDKGNLLSPVAAVEALLQTTDQLPVNVKFFAEGQEEIGSPQLPQFIAENKELLACDLVVSADGLQWSVDQPSIEVALRGMIVLEVRVLGPEKDLHSGLYGGMVQNPIHALAHLVASFHDENGRVTVAGFYDDVEELSAMEREQMAKIPFDDQELKERFQVDSLFGEFGYSSIERIWSRPTLEICGIAGGYQGEGIKGIVPAEAMIKLTCRLAASQDPQKITRAIHNHVANYTLPGVKINILEGEDKGAGAYRMPVDHPGNLAATGILTQLYGKEPFVTRSGGSIPICGLFLKELQAYTVGFSFSYEDENLHSPNEFFRLDSLDKGQKGYVMLLHELAKTLKK
jgi:acetylornithine deacetylase/succinyl-diaminopimelate desuccinylase-like protein